MYKLENFISYYYKFDMELLYIQGCLKKKKSELVDFDTRDLVNLYNFVIKFGFIQDHMKNL